MFSLSQVHPTREQMQLAAQYPKDRPVTMINLLRFKDQTEAGNESGQAAYDRYSQNVFPLLKQAGAEVVWAGNVQKALIGPEAGMPHRVLIVRYPSVQNFLEMATSEAYQAVANDRTIALEYGGLYLSEDMG